MYKNLLIIFLLGGFAFAAAAQTSSPDTTKTKKDIQNRKRDSVNSKRFAPKVTKEKVYHPDTLHDPHKAVMRSLMIPGWGQIYNHQWYLVPVIYAGLGLLVDAIIFNQRNYGPNLVVARYFEHGVAPTPNQPDYNLYELYVTYQVPATTVYSIVNSYDRDRDLSIFGLLGAWGIQVIDAYITAKFQQVYTMDTNFSYKVEPMFGQPVYAQTLSGAFVTGVKVTLRF
jgi:hypothetical protein